MRANPSADLFVVANSTGCTIYDFNGVVISSIPGGAEPVWTPGGTALLLSAPSNAGQTATVWLSKSQESFAIGPPTDRAYVDHPAGADGDAFYFVQSFSDDSSTEVHKTLFADNSDTVIWSGKGRLSGHAVLTDAGVIFAADRTFLRVNASGDESKLDSNPFGNVYAPLRSPGGDGFSFISGDHVIAADSQQPGMGVSIPYSLDTGGGFAYSGGGTEIAIATGDMVAIYSVDGSLEGHVSLSNGSRLVVVAWRTDGIEVVENGDHPLLVLIPTNSIRSGSG